MSDMNRFDASSAPGTKAAGAGLAVAAPRMEEGFDPTSKASAWAIFWRLLRTEVRPFIPLLGASVALMALVGALTAAQAWLIEPALDQIFFAGNRSMLYLVPIAIMAAVVLKGFGLYGSRLIVAHVGIKIMTGLQLRIFRHMINSDLATMQRFSSGQLLTRMINDTRRLHEVITSSLLSGASSILILFFLVSLMFYQDWRLASICFLVFPLASYFIYRIGLKVRNLTRNAEGATANFGGFVGESFRGLRQVKAYRMEDVQTAKTSRLLDHIAERRMRMQRAQAAVLPTMETLGGLAVAAAIFYGGSQVIQESMTPGTFFSFVTALLLAYRPMSDLGKVYPKLQLGLVCAERLYALLDIRSLVAERPDARPLAIAQGEIVLDSVHFRYDQGKQAKRALHGLGLTCPGGRTTALVGPSGAGKSTVFNLVPRFYDPQQGAVRIDGQDVRDVTLDSLRDSIAIVTQDVVVFDDTVYNNIAFAKPDAAPAEVYRAAALAGADDFIRELPKGYDTVLGESGGRLSGGQRQRIAIARAFLKDAPLILLDEPTSALDIESEHRIQRALRTLSADRTVVVIAHRLSTVRDADLIHVLHAGRVVESGSHDELVARGGHYARLHRLQLGADEAGDAVPALAAPCA